MEGRTHGGTQIPVARSERTGHAPIRAAFPTMTTPEPTWRRVLREPLVHFGALSLVVFALHHGLAPPAPPLDEAPLILDEAFVAGLREQHRRMHGAAPDEAQTETLMRAYVRDEVLAREARRLELDRDDPIVRRRRVQMMELWLEASVDVPEPTEEALDEARISDDAYAVPARVAFEHVFYRRAREDAEDRARAALAEGVPDAERLGDPFLLGRSFGPRTREQLAGAFGPAFASTLFEAPPAAWSGPHESSYGWHLVRVTERTEATLPPLEAIRERVRDDLVRARRAEAVRARIDALVNAQTVERGR